MPTQAVYYRDRDGNEPVNQYIEKLDVDHRVTVYAQIDLLNGLDSRDPPLAFPHSSQIVGPLRELRCHHGRTLYRILYRRSGNLFVLLHIINKRDKQVPKEDIAKAQECWKDFEERMDARPRTPPRAAGHDAPPKKRESVNDGG